MMRNLLHHLVPKVGLLLLLLEALQLEVSDACSCGKLDDDDHLIGVSTYLPYAASVFRGTLTGFSKVHHDELDADLDDGVYMAVLWVDSVWKGNAIAESKFPVYTGLSTGLCGVADLFYNFDNETLKENQEYILYTKENEFSFGQSIALCDRFLSDEHAPELIQNETHALHAYLLTNQLESTTTSTRTAISTTKRHICAESFLTAQKECSKGGGNSNHPLYECLHADVNGMVGDDKCEEHNGNWHCFVVDCPIGNSNKLRRLNA